MNSNCSTSGQVETVRYLLKRGADVNARDQNLGTPLMWASENDSSDGMELLLVSGANVNARDRDGKTALISALKQTESSLPQLRAKVKLLLRYGALVNEKDRYGNTALSLASKNWHDRQLLHLLKAAMARSTR